MQEKVSQDEKEAFPFVGEDLISSGKSMKLDPIWVQILITLRMKYAKFFTKRRNSASEGWKLVFQELKESGVPDYVTIHKIKKKWMNLMTRYRQIKLNILNPEMVTWPYYEQIDSAVKKEAEANFDNKLDMSLTHDERQVFIKKLIEFRYTHRHLFTGRRYTARDGWMTIQSLLQCQDKYSIEQLSKCWQNLVHRYKVLSKSKNTEGITWPYFDYMQKWFNNDESVTLGTVEIKCENSMSSEQNIPMKVDWSEYVDGDQQRNHLLERTKVQLLTEIKSSQEKHQVEIMTALKEINQKLNIIVGGTSFN